MTYNSHFHKIIHVDMDCFYAAIEIRDNPVLANHPVAVGGSDERRGVICTCNYIAREYGVRSAMPITTAYRLCRELILLPVNFSKYRQIAKEIQQIFFEFTDLVEPLSLDEAYLDVTHVKHYQGSATRIAQAIRARIWEEHRLIASAGVAPNKFLAKIASGWRKPNGLFIIRPAEIENFIQQLPVEALYGVGQVTAKRLYQLGIKNCSDLQRLSLNELIKHFGKFGVCLYEQARGIDEREVKPQRIRKSLSVESTLSHDIEVNEQDECKHVINELHAQLLQRIQQTAPNRIIKKQFFKIKFSDFTIKTAEMLSDEIKLGKFYELFNQLHSKNGKAIRLLGLGVQFMDEQQAKMYQVSLF